MSEKLIADLICSFICSKGRLELYVVIMHLWLELRLT